MTSRQKREKKSNDEEEERKHFEEIVDCFKYYREYCSKWIAMRRKYFRALPARHQVSRRCVTVDFKSSFR
jgi:hypothetical protein